MSVVASRPVLPDDLFEHIILPDLLSQHLHSLLTDPEPPTWHAFYVLPLVSPLFHSACQRLVSQIFGTKINSEQRVADSDDDNFEHHPSVLLNYAMSVWQRARRSSSQTTSHDFNMDTLMEKRNLIRVYTCIALGKIFLNVDVLLPLGVSSGTATRTHRSPWDEDYEDIDDVLQEPSSLDEANMHRCFMPFNCAQRICDFVTPERLSFVVAQYMAEVLPLYHSLPILAKYALDLRFNVARKYKLELVGVLSYPADPSDSHNPRTGQDEYAAWTLQTLNRLEVIEKLVESMISSGALVRSCIGTAEIRIPAEALKMTGVLAALDDVIKADWGSQANTSLARKKAARLILRWTA